ncbi:vacuolar calcium ion transporter /H(+) exchanger [Byssothecium circinans]|uniref:Vacuolar calcium ion transporter n=1 Tax=Byssothecium circinans TaxID=147558 RepID=A0A6A5TVY0_9PLEO|nr:vacuolar calcium ion transporter /H(+) exchanger [Byssothecium circinans]
MPAPSNGAPTERTSLLGHHLQPHHDEPRWKSLSKSIVNTTYATLTSNYVNILLVFVPLGIVAGKVGWSPTAVFVLNFIAIIPLAALLSFATEELSAKLGQTLGGLCNATFGNAVELIVSIVALKENQIRIVQASMLGSILSNMLLVLGCCFLAGGWGAQERSFNTTVASTMSSLMAVASASLIIPATLYAAMDGDNKRKGGDTERNINLLSRGTSVILLILYVLYLYFQLKSHHSLFTDLENQEEGNTSNTNNTNNTDTDAPDADPAPAAANEHQDGDILSPAAAGITLVLVTILVSVCADFLVSSIDSIVETSNISRTFIGLILIPIVGNAAEHVTAVVVAAKGKMDLAINVAIGSSLQIALFVTPALVILGWIMGKAMTLHFQGFETVVFFLSVLVVNYLIQDGKSNYLEGCMCLGTYAIIALAFYVYPDDASGDLSGNFIGKFFSR